MTLLTLYCNQPISLALWTLKFSTLILILMDFYHDYSIFQYPIPILSNLVWNPIKVHYIAVFTGFEFDQVNSFVC